MSSTRLPGKVLKEVRARPLLSYLIERARFCRGLERIVLATSEAPEDDPIARFSEEAGVLLFRGSESDVLDRYYQAARKFDADEILRLTGDCPLLDPAVCDAVIDDYRRGGIDYAYTAPSFAEGMDCELFSFAALKRAWENADRPSEREHVTLYFRNHPELIRQSAVENRVDDGRYRITVDTAEDFDVVQILLKNLYREGKPFGIGVIKQFLDDHPDVYRRNLHIVRNEGLHKSLTAEKGERP